MDRNIHDIYDVILKLIIAVYGSVFLNFMGIEGELKEELSVEFTTLTGNKFYLDFLGLLDDDTLCHIEFQYPHAKSVDDERFFKYNISAEVRHQKRAETYVFNFDFKNIEFKFKKMGKTKCFCPINFYLEDIDFKKFFENINIKVNSNTSLSNYEEIILLLVPIFPKFKGDVNVLIWISKILSNKELFDESKYEFIKFIVDLEIENFLTKDEQNEIFEAIKMTPQAEELVIKVINEVNQKVLNETEQKGIEQGIEQGIGQGIKQNKLEIAKNMVDGGFSIDEIVEITGLSADEINSL